MASFGIHDTFYFRFVSYMNCNVNVTVDRISLYQKQTNELMNNNNNNDNSNYKNKRNILNSKSHKFLFLVEIFSVIEA